VLVLGALACCELRGGGCEPLRFLQDLADGLPSVRAAARGESGDLTPLEVTPTHTSSGSVQVQPSSSSGSRPMSDDSPPDPSSGNSQTHNTLVVTLSSQGEHRHAIDDVGPAPEHQYSPIFEVGPSQAVDGGMGQFPHTDLQRVERRHSSVVASLFEEGGDYHASRLSHVTACGDSPNSLNLQGQSPAHRELRQREQADRYRARVDAVGRFSLNNAVGDSPVSNERLAHQNFCMVSIVGTEHQRGGGIVMPPDTECHAQLDGLYREVITAMHVHDSWLGHVPELCCVAVLLLVPITLCLLFTLHSTLVLDLACASHSYAKHQNRTQPLPFPINGIDKGPIDWIALNSSIIDCGVPLSVVIDSTESILPRDLVHAAEDIVVEAAVLAFICALVTGLLRVSGRGLEQRRERGCLSPSLWRVSPCAPCVCRKDTDDGWITLDTLAACFWMLTFPPALLSACSVYPDDQEPSLTTGGSLALTVALVVFSARVTRHCRRDFRWPASNPAEWYHPESETLDNGLVRVASVAGMWLMTLMCALVSLNQMLFWGCSWLGISPARASRETFRSRDNPLPIAVVLAPAVVLFVIPTAIVLAIAWYRPGRMCWVFGWTVVISLLIIALVGIPVTMLQERQLHGRISWTSLQPVMLCCPLPLGGFLLFVLWSTFRRHAHKPPSIPPPGPMDHSALPWGVLHDVYRRLRPRARSKLRERDDREADAMGDSTRLLGDA
jgi:MFS family permease